MRIVNEWGQLYKMTDRKYQYYLKLGAQDKHPAAVDFGKCIGEISFDAIRAEPEDFKEALEALEASKK